MDVKKLKFSRLVTELVSCVNLALDLRRHDADRKHSAQMADELAAELDRRIQRLESSQHAH